MDSLLKDALRESAEEIGIDSCSVEIWSRLRPMLTRNLRSIVTPVVALLPEVELGSLKPRTHEVQTVFTAPIEELCRNHRYTHFKRGQDVFFNASFYITHHMNSNRRQLERVARNLQICYSPLMQRCVPWEMPKVVKGTFKVEVISVRQRTERRILLPFKNLVEIISSHNRLLDKGI